jgi:hypothetical protein
MGVKAHMDPYFTLISACLIDVSRRTQELSYCSSMLLYRSFLTMLLGRFVQNHSSLR